jgi:hypothetical protein
MNTNDKKEIENGIAQDEADLVFRQFYQELRCMCKIAQGKTGARARLWLCKIATDCTRKAHPELSNWDSIDNLRALTARQAFDLARSFSAQSPHID